MAEMVEITKSEYEAMKDEVALLDALRAAGVENWGGWDYAIEIYQEEE